MFAVGKVAMRLTSPLEFTTHPLASTISVGFVWFVLSGGELGSAGGIKRESVQTVSSLSISLGLSGIPPRPVMTNLLAVGPTPTGQLCAI